MGLSSVLASYLLLAFFSSWLLLAQADSDAANSLLVQLTSGNFVGEVSVANGTERWLGIPFAQPPVGSLRFKAPIGIINPSRAIENATAFGAGCPQLPSDTLLVLRARIV